VGNIFIFAVHQSLCQRRGVFNKEEESGERSRVEKRIIKYGAIAKVNGQKS